MYQCLKCGQVFKYKRELREHLRGAHNILQISKLAPELFFVEFQLNTRRVMLL